MTYVDEKTHKRSQIDRCEGCLEKGLRSSKPQQADEVMRFARAFLYKPAS